MLSLFIALHRPPKASDALAGVLRTQGALPLHSARDREYFEVGHAYLAPPDHHLVLGNGILSLERSPTEQRFRPCIDVLFKSAAYAYGRRVVGVLLSGSWGQDGAAGLWQIKNRGGVTIVQDPSDTTHGQLPQHAIDHVGSLNFYVRLSNLPTK